MPGGPEVTGGTVSAAGCTQDVFDGDYANPKVEASDGGKLEVALQRAPSASGAQVQVRIVARLASS